MTGSFHPEASPIYPRHLAHRIRAALGDTRVVLLHGPRQSGKSTLARSLVSSEWQAEFRTLDDAQTLAAALGNPTAFVSAAGPLIIDEVQRAPDLFLAIKAEVDRDPRPGRFLLTGSADVHLLPAISESLAGRIESLTLWPLSQGEIEGRRESFVDDVFRDRFQPVHEPVTRADIFRRAARGGFPEVVRRPEEARRRAWFESYVTSILERDIRDIANIEGRADLPRLLALLAVRSASLINVSELSRSSGIPYTTLQRYLTLLEIAFLVRTTPAWSGNLGKRLTKSPKIHMVDTGMMAHLLGRGEDAFDDVTAPAGPLLETFVASELRKQIGWSELQPRLYHFRSPRREEVDLVLEDRRGRIVGIEVKAAGSVADGDFRHLRALADLAGPRFVRGIVLHSGEVGIPFGERLWALPVSVVWGTEGGEDRLAP